MNNREWTAKEDKYIMANWQTMSDSLMAKRLNRTAKAVEKHRNDLRLIKRSINHWTDDEIKTLCLNHCKSAKELSKLLCKTPNAINLFVCRQVDKYGKDWHRDLLPDNNIRWEKSYISAEIAPELILAVRIQQMLRRMA